MGDPGMVHGQGVYHLYVGIFLYDIAGQFVADGKHGDMLRREVFFFGEFLDQWWQR